MLVIKNATRIEFMRKKYLMKVYQDTKLVAANIFHDVEFWNRSYNLAENSSTTRNRNNVAFGSTSRKIHALKEHHRHTCENNIREYLQEMCVDLIKNADN